jgi:hypothetical protein
MSIQPVNLIEKVSARIGSFRHQLLESAHQRVSALKDSQPNSIDSTEISSHNLIQMDRRIKRADVG